MSVKDRLCGFGPHLAQVSTDLDIIHSYTQAMGTTSCFLVTNANPLSFQSATKVKPEQDRQSIGSLAKLPDYLQDQ